MSFSNLVCGSADKSLGQVGGGGVGVENLTVYEMYMTWGSVYSVYV